MHKINRSILAAMLVLTPVMSLCGCNADRSSEAKALCETFCEEVRSGDTAGLMTYIDYGTVTEDELSALIAPAGLNIEQASFVEALRDSTSYTVEEPVYDPKTKTALVNVLWSQGDYSSESAMTADTVFDFTNAILKEADNIITTGIKVDLTGEIPRIMNADEVIDTVYAYTSMDYGIMPGLLSDYYIDGSWVLAPKGIYTNVNEIGLRINFEEEILGMRFVPGVIYTVARGDEVLFVSDVIRIGTGSIRMDFNSDMAEGEVLNEDGFLKSGKYTFFVFDEHSKDICSFECEVETESIEKELIEFEDHKKDYYLSNLVYDIKDSGLMENSFVFMSGWWDYDGTSVGKSAFASNTKTLGFSVAVGSDNETELYYDYYFSEKSDFKDINETEPLFSGSCKPSLYEDQSCYDFDFTPEELKPGFYGLVVYKDRSRKQIAFTAACIVVEETSKDVIG